MFERGKNSSEDMFAIQVSSPDAVNNMCTFFSVHKFGGWNGDIEILKSRLKIFDINDAGFKLFYDWNGATRSAK